MHACSCRRRTKAVERDDSQLMRSLRMHERKHCDEQKAYWSHTTAHKLAHTYLRTRCPACPGSPGEAQTYTEWGCAQVIPTHSQRSTPETLCESFWEGGLSVWNASSLARGQCCCCFCCCLVFYNRSITQNKVPGGGGQIRYGFFWVTVV